MTDAVVSILGDTRVTGTTSEAVAVLGSTYLNGRARGDVVAVLGSVELGPQAEVEGDVVVIGGKLIRHPGAVIHGGTNNIVSFPMPGLEGLRPWARHGALYLRPLAVAPGVEWAWGLALGFLALYVLIAVLFRDPVDRCVETLRTQPGRTILTSVLAMLLTPIVFSLLVVTVIGIPFIPFVAAGLFAAQLFGKAVVLAWIGRSLLKVAKASETLHAALAVLLGGVLVTVLYLVPILGFVVYTLLSILAVGIAIYALILATKSRQNGEPAPAVAGAGPAAGGGSPTGASFVSGADTTSPAASGGGAAAPASGGAAPPYTAFAEGPEYSRPQSGAGTPEGTPAEVASPTQADTSATSTQGAAGGSAPPPPGPGSAAFTPGAGSGAAGATGSGTPSGGPAAPAPGELETTYPRAEFLVRMAALLIDTVLIVILLNILNDGDGALLIILAAYGAVMWKLKGTTIGGIVFGLKVVRVDGRPIDWATATVRALSCFLSLVVAGLGFIWIAFDPGRQAWHDKIAGTAVVRVPKGVSLL